MANSIVKDPTWTQCSFKGAVKGTPYDSKIALKGTLKVPFAMWVL